MSEVIDQPRPGEDEAPPPLMRSWALLNGLVVGWLLVVIVLCWVFSRAFR